MLRMNSIGMLLGLAAIAVAGCTKVKGDLESLGPEDLDTGYSKVELVENQNAVADGTTPVQIRVQLKDKKENPIIGFEPALMAIGAGNHRFQCPRTGTEGVALCSMTTDTPGEKVVLLSNAVLKKVASITFGSAQSQVLVRSENVPANGQAPVVIEIVLRDKDNHPIVGKIPEMLVQGDGETSITCAPSGANGVAVCTVASRTAGEKKVKIIDPPIASQPIVEFTPPKLVATDALAAADGTNTASVQVQLVNGSGAPLVGQTPVLSVSGSGTSSVTCGPSNSSGIATCQITSSSAGEKIIKVTSPSGIQETVQLIFAPPQNTVTPVAVTAPANGSAEVAIEVKLAASDSSPIVGVVPEIKIDGAGQSTYRCTESGTDGIATCYISSTTPGAKTVTVTEPAVAETVDVTFESTPVRVVGQGAPASATEGVVIVVDTGSPGVFPELEVTSPTGAKAPTTQCTPADSSGQAKCYVFAEDSGSYSVAVEVPDRPAQTVEVKFADAKSSLEIDDAVAAADGSASATFTVVLRNSLSLPRIGVTPVVEVSGSGSNTVTCTPSNLLGESVCSVTSTTVGPKTAKVVEPPVSGSVTLNFMDAQSSLSGSVTTAYADTPTSSGTVTITVLNPDGTAKEGFIPVLAVSGGTGLNSSECSPTDSSGQAQCVIRSNTEGTKTITAIKPALEGSISMTFLQQDIIAPSVSVVSSAPPNTNVSPIRVVVTFSESVIGFEESDVVVIGGTIQNFSGSGANFAFDLVPSGGTVSVSIAAGVAKDAAGNLNTVSGSFSRVYDVDSPLVNLTSAAPSLVKDPFVVTAEFTEAVSGFALDDVIVTGGAASNLTGSGATYQFLVTPSVQGQVDVKIGAGSVIDNASNYNLVSNTLSRTNDSVRPSVTLSSASGAEINGSFNVSVQFSEPVSGFAIEDIGVTNASLSSLSGSADSYSFTVTPSSEGEVRLSIGAGVVTDPAGNTNTATASALVRLYDVSAPSATIGAVSPAGSPSNDLSQRTVTISGADITHYKAVVIRSGVCSSVDFSSVSATDVSTDFTFPVTSDGTYQVCAIGRDLAGNWQLGLFASSSAVLVIDTVAPQATLSTTAPNPTKAAFSVAVSFTENVTGLEASDFTVTNGALSAFTGSGSSYSFTVTPSSEGDVTIGLANQAAEDSAGNLSPAPSSLVREYDSVAPSVLGLSDDSAPRMSKTWNWSCAETCTFRYVIDQSSGTSPSGSYTSATSATHSSGDGTYWIHVQAIDDAGNESAVVSVSALMDNTAPEINGLANDAVVAKTKSWTWTCTEDPCSYRSTVTTSATHDFGSAAYSATATASQTTGDGTHWLHVQAKDEAGNESAVVSVSAELDNSGPSSPFLSIAAGAQYTKTSSVTLTLNATGSPTEMYITNTSGCASGGTWLAYSTSSSWTLAQSNSTASAFVKFRDALGNESGCASDTIVHDDTPPGTPTGVSDGTAKNSLSQSPVITFATGAETGTGFQKHQIRVLRLSDSVEMKTWEDFTSGNSVTGLSLVSNTSYRVEVRSIDNAGNISAVGQSDGWIADTTNPGAPSSVTLGSVPNNITDTPPISFSGASDGAGGSGIASYQIKIERVSDSAVISDWSTQTTGAILSGLSLSYSTQYRALVRTIDIAGNTGTATAQATWTTGAQPCLGGTSAFTSPGSYTFTLPSGCSGQTFRVLAVGGGGGGSGRGSNYGGGGGSGYVRRWNGTLTGNVSVTVGAGGTSVYTCDTPNDGTSGGTSSFGGYVSAAGGSGGRTDGYGGSGGSGGGGRGAYGGSGGSSGSGSGGSGGNWDGFSGLIRATFTAGAGGFGGRAWGGGGGGGGGVNYNDSGGAGGSAGGDHGGGGGGQAYGAGGGGTSNYYGYCDAGGNGASGLVYVEWDSISSDTTPPTPPTTVTVGVVPTSRSQTPAISWSGATDSGGAGIQAYQIRIERVSDNAVISDWSLQSSGAVISSLSLNYSTQYRALVRTIDNAGNISTTYGSVTWTSSASPCVGGSSVFTTVGSHTFSVPEGCEERTFRVLAVGGGGGGSGRGSSYGGGGGSGYVRRWSGTPTTTTVLVTVGDGGTSQYSCDMSNNGTAGGSSSFGSYVTASGGQGGRTDGTGGSGGSGGGGRGAYGGSGGSSGSGSGGSGGNWDGFSGLTRATFAAGAGGFGGRSWGGGGGGGGGVSYNSSGGAGGSAGNDHGGGSAGQSYGAGGGGTSNYYGYCDAGGAGASGLVYVEWD